MKKDIFFEQLADILDVPKEHITEDYVIEDGDWDSITTMAVSAALDEVFDVIVPVKKLRGCHSVGEIVALVKEV